MEATSSSSTEIVNAFEEVVPSSISAASSSAPPFPSTSFHVFINHCGEDVKHTLATNICDKLTDLGLSVFLDVHSLQLGDVIPALIEEAMRTASLHIAIFSINYAKSPWCLAELSFMLKTGNRIIPVFYHVDPSDLRWVAQGKGMYAPAFSRHEEQRRYSSEKVEEWKKALEKVSFHSGCVVKDNKDEGMLLKNIVNMVSKVLEKVPLLGAQNPVGLDDVVLDFERKTLESAQNVQIVGIVGMGGVGKTTLAKELYNRKSSSFHSCSFVFAVRDAASRNALHEKQKKLLEDIGVKGLLFDNMEEGKSILANRLRSVRALIVLDDVDHKNQLDALLPTKDCLGSGSLVIVTTRELHLLAKWGPILYRMEGLNHFHAKELFCWHAFLQSYPQEGFEGIVESFLKACNGLPLSLEVFGGLVYGRSKDYWESQLDKISRMLPEDIKGRLSVSYNALDQEEKEMFMDVASFFIGKQRSFAIEVWDGSGWSGLHGWETLVNKCLVNVDEHNDITMHDHLIDLGRDIASRQSPSRVWLPQQIFNIEKKAREGSIRGIVAAGLEYTDEPLRHQLISNGCFAWPPPSSPGLKALIDREEKFIKDLATPSEDLVWLHVSDFKRRELPSWLSLRTLRYLELNNAFNLRYLWRNTDHLPLQLRGLYITNAHILQRIPTSIGRLKELKRIELFHCKAIKNLPEEFCCLSSLEWLSLECCEMLSSLPNRFGDLINLRHIDLQWCERLQELPVSFKQLRHLQYLNLFWCKQLSLRLDMLENMKKLEHLNFNCCSKLVELPNRITDQVYLRELRAFRTGLREVPSNIDQLRKLKILVIGSDFLKSVPSSLGNLSSLTVLRIQSPLLTSLPSSLGNLSSLTVLNIETPLLTSLPSSLGNLSSLTELIIRSPLLTSWPSSLGNLPSLTRLSIETPLLTNFSSCFQNLSCLTELYLRGAAILNSVADLLARLNMLKRLGISDARVSTLALSEDCCPSLETLILYGNNHLTDIESLPTSLQIIYLLECPMLKNIRGIGGLVNLRTLRIRNCAKLDEPSSFADLHSIEDINISDCDRFLKAITSWKSRGIQSWEEMEKLKMLHLRAKNTSALQPCIQAIKKWPCQTFIVGRAMSSVESVMESLSFPKLTVIRERERWLQYGKTHSSDAAILCSVVNMFETTIIEHPFLPFNIEYSAGSMTRGKWVFVCVFRRGCSFMDTLASVARRRFKVQTGRLVVGEVERGMLMVGEEERVLEAFTHLWPLFM